MDNTKQEKSETTKGRKGETATEEIDAEDGAILKLLKQHPGGFSVAPNGIITADREAVNVTSIEQFSELVREPRTVVFQLHGGKAVRFKVRPLDVNEQREIDDLDSEAPLPPPKKQPQSPSIARGVRPEQVTQEYDWQDKEYRRKAMRHRELKRAAVICKGLLDLEIPGKTIEKKAEYLAEKFTVRILDGIEASIGELSTEPIERAVFT
jgi:hypothetical protein